MRSDEVLDMIKAWIQKCLHSHKYCSSHGGAGLPTRVIDVGGTDSVGDPRLLLSEDASKNEVRGFEVDSRYVALSYCWGDREELKQRPSLVTTSATLRDHLRSLPLSRLLRTIVDAIVLTRRLGVRYLWVDRLCIIQDCAEDWEIESSKMSAIYGGAFLTFAAAWGSSVHDGLFTVRPSNIEESVELFWRSPSNPSPSNPSFKGNIRLAQQRHLVNSWEEPLYSRGWTLQERILSPRVLIYNRDQLAWECQNEQFTESGCAMNGLGSMRLDREFSSKLVGDSTVFPKTWQCIVTDYSKKSHTVASDKLPAIAGIAKKFHEFHLDEYLAGLWRNSLLDDLLWVHGRFRPSPNYNNEEYRAPSWSWAAVNGYVRWPFANRNGTYPHFSKLVDYEITKKGRDEFGQVSDGYIVLEGPTWRLPTEANSALEGYNTFSASILHDRKARWPRLLSDGIFDKIEGVPFIEAYALESNAYGHLLSVLRVSHTGGLLLALDEEKTSSEGRCVYTRVGVIISDDRFTEDSQRIDWDVLTWTPRVCKIH